MNAGSVLEISVESVLGEVLLGRVCQNYWWSGVVFYIDLCLM